MSVMSAEVHEAFQDEDSLLLSSLGYRQELRRGLSSFMAFAFCFTAVSMISSLTIQVGFGLSTGGPAVMVWGWCLGSLFSILTGLSMAEICSTYPTAGSVYQWAGFLCSDEWAPLASYVTGWFNLLGNVCGDVSFAYGFAQLAGSAALVADPDRPKFEEWETVLAAMVVSCLWALLNTLRIDSVGWINNFAAFFQVASTLGIVVTVLSLGSSRQSASFVFSSTYNGTGFGSSAYVAALGLLTTLFTFSGYEAGAHMAEETRHAATAAPLGIVATCLMVAVTGFAYMVGLLLATASVSEAVASDNAAVYIFVSSAGRNAGLAMTALVAANLFFAGMSSSTVTARMLFAMARDRTVPFGQFLEHVNGRTQTPLRATAGVLLTGNALLLLPLVSETAFTQITALCTIGYQVSYAIPILLRVTVARHTFEKSKFHLGRWSLPVGWASGVWLSVSSVLFFLPTTSPITAASANYAPAVVGGVLLLMAVYWRFGARYTSGWSAS